MTAQHGGRIRFWPATSRVLVACGGPKAKLSETYEQKGEHV
jgi:hypothetical protein